MSSHSFSTQEETTGPKVDLPPEGQFGLMGREADVGSLSDASRVNPLVLLAGPPGVGKTELACGFARRLAESGERPGGVLFISFEYGAGLTRVLHEIGTTFQGIRYARFPLEEQRRWVVDYLRDTPTFLVWDNFERVFGYLDQTECQQLVDLIRELADGPSYVLVTGRRKDWLEATGVSHGVHELTGLSASGSRTMAAVVLEGTGVDLDGLGPRYEELLQLLKGNPMAMRLVLPHLKGRSPQELVQLLRSVCGGPPRDGVIMKDSLGLSFSLLSTRTRRHLPSLSLFQQRVLLDVLTFMTQGEVYSSVLGEKQGWGACRTLLREARDHGLLDSVSPSVYLISSSVAPFLRKQLAQQTAPASVEALQQEFLRVYTGLAEHFLETLGTEESESTVTGVLAEEANLLQALRVADEDRQWESVQLALQPLGQVYKMQERIPELRRLREGLLAHIGLEPQQAEKAGARDLWMYLQGTEINDCIERGEMERAEVSCRSVLRYLESLQDPQVRPQLASTYHYLGVVAQSRHEYDQAEEWYRRALEISEPLGSEAECADSYHQLGLMEQARKRYGEADGWHGKALAIRERTGDEGELGNEYHQLGLVAEGLMDLDRAFDTYIKGQAAYEGVGDKAGAAAVYHRLGLISQAHFRYEDAVDWYQRALLNYEELTDEDGGASDYFQMGVITLRRQEHEEAEEWLHQSLEAYGRTGNDLGEAHSCHHLGVVAHAQGRAQEAEEWYQKALETFVQTQDDISAASTWGQLGLLADQRGNYAHAVWYVAHTYEIAVAHQLELLEQAKRHLASLRSKMGTDAFLGSWQEVSDRDVLSELEPA